jgi:hypothetical protein
MPLVKRLIKGSTLTYQEMDDNLSYLDNKVSGSSGYITRFSGSTALTSSLLNQIASTVFVYGSFNVSQSLTVNNSSVVTLASPSYYIATGSVTASVDVNSSKIFSITSASVNFAQIDTIKNNTSFGQNTLRSGSIGIYNTAFGYGTLNSNNEGVANTAVGYGALITNTNGDENVAIGGNALSSNITGSNNTAVGSAALDINVSDDNTALGSSAGLSNTIGAGNTFLGTRAGRLNVTGSYNVFIGLAAGTNEPNSNKLYIANSSTATPLIKGDFSTGLLQLNTPTGTYITGALSIRDTGNKSEFQVNNDIKQFILSDNIDPFNQFQVALSGSLLNSSPQVKLTSSDKGFNIDDTVKILSTGTQITGSLTVSGSGATFYNIITLPTLSTLSSGVPTGSFAVSGSNANNKPYYYNGSTWTALF